MPYILPEDRSKYFDKLVEHLAINIRCPGDFNYCIARLYTLLVQKNGKSYHELSRWLAAVRDCGDEIYRRVVGPYEDEAIAKNGDCFDEVL